MKQQEGSNVRYSVTSNEVVAIRVLANKVGLYCSASVDGQSCDVLTHTPLTYQVKATGHVGAEMHFAFSGAFIEADPDNKAYYQLFPSGNAGGPEFKGPVLDSVNTYGTIGLHFEVVG